MNTNEIKKGIGRFFIRPKDWRKPTNLELDELLSIALYHPQVAEKEICDRFNYWYGEYHQVRKAMLIASALLPVLSVGCYAQWPDKITTSAGILFGIAVLTSLCLMRRRARAINERLRNCYHWLMCEIIHPNTNPPESYLKIEEALLRRFDEIEKLEQKEEKKFRRLVCSFGYTLETINN